MTERSVIRAFAAAAATAIVFCVRAQAPAPSPQIDFAQQVYPIFQKSCQGCHGAKMQMGGLRLDAKANVFAGGQSGKIIQPGDTAHSSLYQRVAGLGDQPRMPMGGKLKPEEIEIIRAWIQQGAAWPDDVGLQTAVVKKHWAFLPPVRPALPEVKNTAWVANPIDRFILVRLEKEGLTPSPEADRVTLLRRVSLDLTGLPPTPQEVDAFVADKSPKAYEKVVDRLLASPHYGERWGRVWLDVARYADSDGFEKDKQRSVWFYRDWIINALNRDLPYNEFVIDQIAGDLLPHPTQDQIVATGFLRNSMINEEGGVDPEQFRMEAMFDRMDAIGKGILGVTIQCAQCHNHKYDPLKQEEYYKLFAFLNNSHEGAVAVYTPQEQMKRAEIFRRTHEIEARLQHTSSEWQKRMADWEAQVSVNRPEWVVVKPEVDDISNGGQKYNLMPDGSFLAAGYAPTKHTVKMTAKTDLHNITGFRLELMNDDDLPMGGPGRSIFGTAALTEFMVEAAPADKPDEKPVSVKMVKATADFNPPETLLPDTYNDKSDRRRVTGPIEFAIDGKDTTAWCTDAGPGRRNVPRNAVFTPEKPVSFEKGAVLVFKLKQDHGGWNSDDNQNYNLGRFRLSITTAADPVADDVPANVRQILAIPAAQRSPAQVQAVFGYWRTTVPEYQAANKEIDELWKQHPEGASQLVLRQREDMRETHILTRGDFLKPAKTVTPGVPSFLNQLPEGAKPDRLAFAKWMVAPDAPTTARSLVNRLWQAYFGIGIVATAENFGTQCEPPSHPELLDWLAVEFMQGGWSQKKMHRLIATSAAYRQSSHVTPEMLNKDPYNRLIAHGPRFRVDAEVVRDITLAASGLLNEEVGGPSVYPPAPAFLFQPPASYGPKIWREETGVERYRRALYTHRYRSVPYPMLEIFDAPNGDVSCVRRSRSNTPLQALTALNEPLALESARALALKALATGDSDEQKLTYAFRRCLSRRPEPKETAELLRLLDKQKQRATDGWLDVWSLTGLKAGMELPKGTTPVQFAAWTAVSRVLLNLDETITKE
jgi:mono/diheme cytochrome c family protein